MTLPKGKLRGKMSSEQKGEELCVLTVLPAPISVKDAHVPETRVPTDVRTGSCL